MLDRWCWVGGTRFGWVSAQAGQMCHGTDGWPHPPSSEDRAVVSGSSNGPERADSPHHQDGPRSCCQTRLWSRRGGQIPAGQTEATWSTQRGRGGSGTHTVCRLIMLLFPSGKPTALLPMESVCCNVKKGRFKKKLHNFQKHLAGKKHFGVFHEAPAPLRKNTRLTG